MVLINEFLPNPIGEDKIGEFIELYNGGFNPISLSGHFLRDESGKTFYLSGMLGPKEYLNLPRSLTKIAINNSDETLFLYDAEGRLLDKAAFLGSAKEGGSFSRVGEVFLFTETPTPGIPNKYTLKSESDAGLAAYSYGTISLRAPSLEIITLALTLGVVFGLGAAYFFKNAIYWNR